MSNLSHVRLAGLASMVTAMMLAPVATMAQGTTSQATNAPPAGGLAEVVVTAERFSTNVQTTPVAVTALTSETLEERQVTNVLESSSQIPGIVITPATGTSNGARIVLRGAGQEQSGINFDPAVGIYVDNVYQPRINGAFFDFFDLERIEVLRGPQGTLYGRNTSGGAIKIETLRPTFHWTGAAELSGGNWDSRQARAYVSGPLMSDKVAFSLSGVIRKRDGFIYGTAYGKDLGRMDRRAVRGKVLITPNDKLDIEASFVAQQDNSDPGIGVPLQVGAGVVDPLATGRDRDLTVTEVFGPYGQSLRNNEATLNVKYKFSPELTLSSTTGYGDLTQRSSGTILWITAAAQASGNGALNIGAGGDGRTFDRFTSQEFDLTYSGQKLRGVAGLYYFKERGRNYALLGNINDQIRDTKALAAFMQLTYDVTDTVSLTLGDRYTKEDAEFSQWYHLLTPAPQTGYKKSFTGTSPKFGINWQATDNLFTYASLTKGFKSGGFNPVPPNTNTGVPGQIAFPVPYGPETVKSYELGVKFQTANHRLRVNTALFQAEYSGLQLPVFFPGTSSSYTSNASSATIKGLELEPTWQVTDSLQLYSIAAWTQGKYTQSFICSGSDGVFRDCSGNHIKGVIPHKIVTGFAYTPELPLPGRLRISGDWSMTGAYFNNVANSIYLVQTQAADIYNGSISWTAPDDKWSLTLDGRNLANKHYVIAGLQLSSPVRPAVTGYINEPRQVTLRFRMNFK